MNKTLPPLSSTLSPSHESLSASFPNSLSSRPSTTSHTVIGSGSFPFRQLSQQPSPIINEYGHDEFSGQWFGLKPDQPGSSPVKRSPADMDGSSDIRFIDSGSLLSGDEITSQDGSAAILSSAISFAANAINQLDVDNFVRISSPPKSLILAGSAIYVLFNHGSEARKKNFLNRILM